MKKIISFALTLIAVIFLVPGVVKASNDAAPKFQLSTASGAPGDVVSIDLDVVNNPGITALQVQIGYSAEDVELVSVEDKKLFGDAISCGKQDADPFTISWFSSASKNVKGTGTLAVLKFRIKEGGKSSDVTLRYDKENVFDISLESIPFQTVDGKVIVTSEESVGIGEKKVNGALYQVVSDNTAEYLRPENSKISNADIPASVWIDGKKYKVISIAEGAFRDDKKLKTVKIGRYVKTIGANAFYNCRKLKEITIPAKVEKIGERAFYNCKQLRKITINTKKLTNETVGSQAFKGGYLIPTVKTPKNYKKIYKKVLSAKGMSKIALYK